MTLPVWKGISDHHKKLASKDRDLEDVMEVLGNANDDKIQAAQEEAAFESQNNISNRKDCHGLDWPQMPTQEYGGKIHRTTLKVMQWKNDHTDHE
ncbi:hypothetical protein N7449_005004 [Penicillium cf. viridicatum]|uniref:Uncharacterized protein n=1 Tax=Penicillium cf. viridicatum TaxID=2972119 RepID=A0A9W9SYX2_9EURO|nr:hypothetical protein N7449_005004 [Penicillium cf. viridicatum]